MGKNNKSGACDKKVKNAATNAPSIDKLNNAYKRIERAQEAFATACKKGLPSATLTKLNKAVNAASDEFKKIRSQLPPVKFDYVQGEYLLADRDCAGTEIFRVSVTQMCNALVEVRARNAKEAKMLAEREVEQELEEGLMSELPIVMEKPEIISEVVSTMA